MFGAFGGRLRARSLSPDPKANLNTAAQRVAMADPSGTLGRRQIAQARLAKLPPSWKENPTLWFSQVGAMFAISRITADTTKFHYIVTNLNTEPLPSVSDIITNPPAQDKYDTLKERLINSFSETNESKLRRIFRGVEFFDEKPSNVLQHLRNLAGNQVSDTVLRTLFLEHLPEQVRGILSISEVADLTRLALQADKIMEVTKPSIFAIDKYPSSSASTTASKQSISNNIDPSVTLENLTARIYALTKNFEHLDQHVRGRDQSRHRARSRYVEELKGCLGEIIEAVSERAIYVFYQHIE
ncbi:unnamed protein product [Ceutorhynchus assimilis]|uniref:DUF7041 domain-containing protein n=1 Tax=Ceutorhynchus assimilis TaxID=467358 RepID=A0A9N9QMV5_9CUCU|nr:unnamed protein product [Ceutorhynchus assimilis]